MVKKLNGSVILFVLALVAPCAGADWNHDGIVSQAVTAGVADQAGSLVGASDVIAIIDKDATSADAAFKIMKDANTESGATALFSFTEEGSLLLDTALTVTGSSVTISTDTLIKSQLLKVSPSDSSTSGWGFTFNGGSIFAEGNGGFEGNVSLTGNIGIGTKNPTSNLTMYSFAGNTDTTILVRGGTNRDAVISLQSDIGATASKRFNIRSDSVSNDLQFYSDSVAASTAYMTFTGTGDVWSNAGGNFGVGTNAPLSKLEVAGGFFQVSFSSAGAPNATDCDTTSEQGRIITDTTNDRLYICNTVSGRGWDHILLID